MTKEYLISFSIEGIGGGSSYITVEDGRVSTQSAEDEFYAILRKNEKAIIKDAEEEEKSDIVDKLTSEQEDKLKEEHAKDYHGCDDDMPDDYEDWLVNLSAEELKKII